MRPAAFPRAARHDGGDEQDNVGDPECAEPHSAKLGEAQGVSGGQQVHAGPSGERCDSPADRGAVEEREGDRSAAEGIGTDLNHDAANSRAEQRGTGSDPDLAHRLSEGEPNNQMAGLMERDRKRERDDEARGHPENSVRGAGIPKADVEEPPDDDHSDSRSDEATEPSHQRRFVDSRIAHASKSSSVGARSVPGYGSSSI